MTRCVHGYEEKMAGCFEFLGGFSPVVECKVPYCTDLEVNHLLVSQLNNKINNKNNGDRLF